MKHTTLFYILFHFVLTYSWAQNDFETRLRNFNLDENYIAIDGYDPVAYFESKKAMQGEKKYSCSYKSVVYYFTSQRTLELFKSSPNKYEPAYGGWCAYAMSKNGEKMSINPTIFKIQNDRLFLFYDNFFTSKRDDWEQEKPHQLEKEADNHWKKILSKKRNEP